jgi:hypothetical protein
VICLWKPLVNKGTKIDDVIFRAGEQTGSSWIKLPKRLITHTKEGLTPKKNGIEINVNAGLR